MSDDELPEISEFEGEWSLQLEDNLPIHMNSEETAKILLSFLNKANMAINLLNEKTMCEAGDCADCDFLRSIVKLLE